MKEAFLHYIWQYQYFEKKALQTLQGEPIEIIHQGHLNTDAGPDFANAQIKIGAIAWAGHVEIHVKASDWYTHGHHLNEAYNNTILHVVWEGDKDILRQDGSPVATLVLAKRTNLAQYQRYAQMVDNPHTPIPCATRIATVNPLKKLSMLDKVLMQRLENKAESVRQLLALNKNNWEETAYQLLGRNFGFKVNAEAMLALTQALPLRIIQKHKDSLLQIEALLLGQAGFLGHDMADDYPNLLRREFSFLSHKYNLAPDQLNMHRWKMLRLRPANFPVLRLVQLAALLHKIPDIFATITEAESVNQLQKLMQVTQSGYWQTHYLPDKQNTQQVPPLGLQSIDNIIINTAVPLLVCFAQMRESPTQLYKAIHWLESLKSEQNKIIDMWQNLGLDIKNAFDAQASIELYNNYCTPKKCLICTIGVELLK